jgi:hypothetical protein
MRGHKCGWKKQDLGGGYTNAAEGTGYGHEPCLSIGQQTQITIADNRVTRARYGEQKARQVRRTFFRQQKAPPSN